MLCIKKCLLRFSIVAGLYTPVQLTAQTDKAPVPSHIIHYLVDGVDTEEEVRKLNGELLSRKGVQSSDFDLRRHILTVKASAEIEDKHVFHAIVKAGFKPLEVVKD